MAGNLIRWRILDLISKKEKTLTDYMEISSGCIPSGSMSKALYKKHINKRCEYLDTTPNYLFFGEDNKDLILIREKNMIRTFRILDDEKMYL